MQLPWRLVLRLLLPSRLRRRWQNLRRYSKGRVNINRSICVNLAFHRDEVRQVTFKHKHYSKIFMILHENHEAVSYLSVHAKLDIFAV